MNHNQYIFDSIRRRYADLVHTMAADAEALEALGWLTSASILLDAAREVAAFNDFATGFPKGDGE